MKSHSTTLLTSILLVFALVYFTSYPVQAQKKKNWKVNAMTYPDKLYNAMKWRSIGPYRGGRSAAVTGVTGKPNLFYFGAAGGGVWRTRDGGSNWENISDGFFGGSIGAVAVSEYDNNVIYVGGGEKTVRGNVSFGYGMWKSVDAGKTWKQIGLVNSRHISRIRIHPKNPDLVYVAVMGNLFAANADRGVYRTKDGGQTWEKILYSNDQSGAVDLLLDPTNPRIIYASTWRIIRTPYSLSSGGEGSGLWKSTDAGNTWINISQNKGLPQGPIGIIGVAVSPVSPERVWALIEAEKGGLFRSENGGETWELINSERKLRQRAWYYTRIYADTQREDVVYVVNVDYHRSQDGGKTFADFRAPHGDHHDLWIAPEDPNRMIIGDDGGAQVSYDGGNNWSTYLNQPTAQFYRVTTDNHFPYRIYGAQQDNSTVRIYHRVSGAGISPRDWENSAGGESAHLAIDPLDNEIVYGGSYGGYLTRVNHRTKEERGINVWPDNPMGHGAEDMKYRFQWNFPIFFSPHDPKKLYTTSNHLHVSYDEGHSWEVISPDLTRNDASTLGPSGGPITKDNTAVEYYGTIFAANESPYEKDVLWCGSDDGLIHVSRDGGKNWQNVTPPDAPKWLMINSIEADPFVNGGAYVAGTLYKAGDFSPYIYKTKNYGQTWTKITNGIASEHFTRVVRADPKRAGLLYAGTETGMYISFDDGRSWKPFQLNLPIVPITDLTVKNDNLIAATQGRSFWLIDDITPLHQLTAEIATSEFYLYQPLASYRVRTTSSFFKQSNLGENHHNGVLFHYYLKYALDTTDQVNLDILEMNGDLIRSFSNMGDKKDTLKTEEGMNRFVWDMRYEPAEEFEGLIMWSANINGPKALPGKYKARLTVNNNSQETEFEILADPRSTSNPQDMKAQFDFLMEVHNKLTQTHKTIKEIRVARTQLQQLEERIKKDEKLKDLMEESKSINQKMTAVEEKLYQTKNESRQDPLNFPIRLNNKLAHLNRLMGTSDFPPTQQALGFKNEVIKEIDDQLDQWKQIKDTDIPRFNDLVKSKQIDAINISDLEEKVSQ